MHKIIKDYRNNDTLRKSFNNLAKTTFDIDFEDWYQNGYWGDKYNPYSVVIDNKVVANVSVNKIDMEIDGVIKYYIQLGTVMTDEACRNQGLIRKIMAQIDEDYADADGFFLFANDSVVEFYPKFGFMKSNEYEYSRKVSNDGECQLEKVIMDNVEAWKQLENVMNNNIFKGKFDMVNNNELIMFYVTKFMQENVYYHRDTDTFVIAEIDDQCLFIHDVFSSKLVELDRVIKLFGKDIQKVTLGFVPNEVNEYEIAELHEEDCTFFVRGKEMEILEKMKLRMPILSHA